MTQAGLVKSMGETIVRPPAIMVEEALIVRAQNRGRLRKATTWQDRIDGNLGAHENPEPLEACGHSPTRLIEPVDQTVPHRHLKLCISRCGFLTQPGDGPAQRTAAHGETVTPGQYLSGPLVGNSQLPGQMRGHRHSP